METIKPNELRIGNWIYFVDTVTGIEETIPFQVTIDSLKDIATNNYDPQITEFRPIPLTEQWLLNAGFEKGRTSSNHIICYDLDDFQINTYIEFNGDFWLRHYHSPRNKNFKYVHQLQNIYFATSQEELIFNR